MAKNDQYETFKSMKDEMRYSIHPDITVAKRRIGVYFCPDDDYNKTFQKLADLFERMTNFFSPHTYANKSIESITEVKVSETMSAKRGFVQSTEPFPAPAFPTEDSYRIGMEEMAEIMMYRG